MIVFTTATGGALDSEVFSQDKSDPANHLFQIGEVTNFNKAGTYNLKWKYYFSQQPTRFVESPIFTVNVLDKCAPHDGSAAP